MRSFKISLFLSTLCPAVYAGNSSRGQPCSVGNNRLQVGTYQFWDDCNSVTFCSSKSICEPKGCRSDDFPFGYITGTTLPPKCSKGQFCPDEGSECEPQLPVGSPCQLNRDDQCQGPPNFQELADTSGRGLNYNGSVCLNNICMWANATLNSPCFVENTPYIVYGASGESIDIVSRGNCKVGHYCDTVSKVCMASKAVGAACNADKECDTYNCMASGVCGLSASAPRQFGAWVYVLVALGIICGMGGVLFGLYVTHREQREIERAKREQYWREQNAFHQNLMRMRNAAARIPIHSASQKSKEASDASYPSIDDEVPKLRLRHLGDSRRDFDDRLARLSRRFDPGRF